MKKTIINLKILMLMGLLFGAHAERLRAGLPMEFVSIAHPGNEAHAYTHWSGSGSQGRVDYCYRIGKYEVTAEQWNTFLAQAELHESPLNDRGLFDEPFTLNGLNKPQIQVSWYHAAQFCNWLTSGDTRKGAYQFHSTSGALLGINRAAAKSQYVRVYVLPTLDEWYKAAYFKPDGSGYSRYANGTSTAPSVHDDANYPGGKGGDSVNPVWDVGSGVQEQNGTYDMMGNVWEWMEEAKDGVLDSPHETMGLLGGSAHWVDYERIMSGTGFIKTQPANDPESWIGFRVVMIGPHCPEVSLKMSDGIQVEFNTAPGTTYTLEASADMFSWSEAITDITGDGSPKIFSFEEGGPARYFRVKSHEL